MRLLHVDGKFGTCMVSPASLMVSVPWLLSCVPLMRKFLLVPWCDFVICDLCRLRVPLSALTSDAHRGKTHFHRNSIRWRMPRPKCSMPLTT